MIKPISANIKATLVIIAVFIIIGLLWYSQKIVERLQERERQIVTLYAKTIDYIANNDPNANYDYTFLFTEVIQTIDFPLILSEADNTPIIDSYRNIDVDTSLSRDQKVEYFKKLMNEMDNVNPPIVIRYQGNVYQIVHYGESYLIKQLKWLPIIEIIIAIIFVLIGYIGFSYIKKNEQSNIWVGMAKETAHQLGTPLSSIFGWLELLKSNDNLDIKAKENLSDIENDVHRLNKVATRFSKIGSVPDLQVQNIEEVIKKVMRYFEKRIPQMSKRVDISIIKQEGTSSFAKINAELFEWVLENLIKNALDSFENNTGKITIILSEDNNNFFVDVTDTGKGIEEKYTRDVFRPGYSTKKRGWGLGLSLARRVIEDYHRGKIFIKETTINKGTTFRIKLQK
jgi:hypothetical protein